MIVFLTMINNFMNKIKQGHWMIHKLYKMMSKKKKIIVIKNLNILYYLL
jgi:hypothetical protein